jgi:putative transposase
MGRPLRAAPGGYVYHVLNRANARMTIFEDVADYQVFENVLAEAVERTRTRLLAYCVMPDHWHLVVWPRKDGELSQFVGWLTLTHTQRWHAQRKSTGSGHVYQGRFKSFPVQKDGHFYTVARYGTAEVGKLLAAWPLPRKPGWTDHVNVPQAAAELQALRQSVERGRPFGDGSWTERIVHRLALETTVRPRGRPRKSI